MNIVVITGYGDRDDYIKLATKNWPKRFGSKVHIIKFGWSGQAASYDKKWQKFSETIREFDKVAIIGISAGASVALRAMQTYPDNVTRVITISGPVQLAKMGRKTLHKNFPVLLRSLDNLSPEGLPVERVMTLRASFDEVANTQAMIIPGATNLRMNIVGHPISIVWGMFHHAKNIHDFIRRPV